ncbi:hypothetical protein JZ751_022905 [Albula glossodonta]|uniref:Uncharacterized protein n=1 Tax=Albula glossodonta TaxID=121402 RepID=A0A8T2PGM2_9TELE|nr:hypothetical protein JZ751_022905 [Albula glossodonta]
MPILDFLERKELKAAMTKGGYLSRTWALLSAAIILGCLNWGGITVLAADTHTAQTESTTMNTTPEDSFTDASTSAVSTLSSLPPTSSSQGNDTDIEPSNQGLSPGEAAGVAIGTIAGVAAIECLCYPRAEKLRADAL